MTWLHIVTHSVDAGPAKAERVSNIPQLPQYTTAAVPTPAPAAATLTSTLMAPTIEQDPNSMDWELTVNQAHGAQGAYPARVHAAWVSAEVVDHRQKNHLCLRCGTNTHFMAGCPFAPA